MNEEARKKALDAAAREYEEARRKARQAAIECEDKWATMMRLADDDFDALEGSLNRLFERRGE
jgi:hypothetical protein